MTITNYNHLKNKLDEIYMVNPNSFQYGWLTFLYKRTTSPLKYMPLLYIIPFSSVCAVCAYKIMGSLFIHMVTILQHGF